VAEVEESAPEELGVVQVEENAPEEVGVAQEETQRQTEEEEESREGGGQGSTSTRVQKRPFSNEDSDETDSKVTKKMRDSLSHNVVDEIVTNSSWKLSSEALNELKKILEGLPTEPPSMITKSRLMKLPKPRNVEEGIQYCMWLLEHLRACDAKRCKGMAKAGPSWVLRRLGHVVGDESKMQDIHQMLTTSTNLFRV